MALNPNISFLHIHMVVKNIQVNICTHMNDIYIDIVNVNISYQTFHSDTKLRVGISAHNHLI